MKHHVFPRVIFSTLGVCGLVSFVALFWDGSFQDQTVHAFTSFFIMVACFAVSFARPSDRSFEHVCDERSLSYGRMVFLRLCFVLMGVVFILGFVTKVCLDPLVLHEIYIVAFEFAMALYLFYCAISGKLPSNLADPIMKRHCFGIDAPAAKRFYSQPELTQKKAFIQYSLQEQLGLFFYGNQLHVPPAMYLAPCFALNGASAVELLRAKLAGNADDLMVRDIVFLFATIDAMRQYDVASDAELMALLGSQVARMHDEDWRGMAEQMVARMGHQRGD
jgi:hypothetical protein